jgi:hypothetical protein
MEARARKEGRHGLLQLIYGEENEMRVNEMLILFPEALSGAGHFPQNGFWQKTSSPGLRLGDLHSDW